MHPGYLQISEEDPAARPIRTNDIALVPMTEDHEKHKVSDHVVLNTPSLEDDGGDFDAGFCSSCVEKVETVVASLFKRNQNLIVCGVKTILVLAYMAYFGYCMYLNFGNDGSYILIAITAMIAIKVIRGLAAMSKFKVTLSFDLKSVMNSSAGMKIRKFLQYTLYLVALVGLGTFLGFEILTDHPENARSLLGMTTIIVFCFICSEKPSRVNWHTVFWGIVVMFAFAIFTLRTKIGYEIFESLGDLLKKLLSFANVGARFVVAKDFRLFGLAFKTLGTVIFFNSLIFLMNHWGVLEFIVMNIGYALGKCLDTGPVESVIAVANIFMGLFEAPLLIRPYLPTVTKSELHTIMACGFASINSSLIAVYAQFGTPANHLMTAAVISAPAALAVSKIIYPETQRVDYSKQTNIRMTDAEEKSRSALSVISEGAVTAVALLVSVFSIMLAFVSILSMVDSILGWLGGMAGYENLSFYLICSYALYPLSFLMGADLSDCGTLGTLIGVKLFATPMVAYTQLGQMIKNRHVFEAYMSNVNGSYHFEGRNLILDGANSTVLEFGVMTERTEVIATYAMCGFSALTAIGISLGSLVSMSPERKNDVLSVIMKAFLAGNMACFITGAVAGAMFTQKEL